MDRLTQSLIGTEPTITNQIIMAANHNFSEQRKAFQAVRVEASSSPSIGPFSTPGSHQDSISTFEYLLHLPLLRVVELHHGDTSDQAKFRRVLVKYTMVTSEDTQDTLNGSEDTHVTMEDKEDRGQKKEEKEKENNLREIRTVCFHSRSPILLYLLS